VSIGSSDAGVVSDVSDVDDVVDNILISVGIFSLLAGADKADLVVFVAVVGLSQ
jgi:hypothetical protein